MLRTYAQLLRLPNVFTALADICLGALAVGSVATPLPFLLTLLASACLYCSGMIWNDVFDVEQDRRERPFRPIPSGRISRTEAGRLAALLMAIGMILALLAGWRTDGFHFLPAAIAGCLIVAIFLYDVWLKHTWLGPIGMGTCRFLNVLLGLSTAGEWVGPWGIHLALVVGVYIVGVTWFARTEARESKRTTLSSAAVVMLAALLIAVPLPSWFEPDHGSIIFPYLLVVFGFAVGLPAWQAIQHPTPVYVQAAVKRAILGLIVLDAILATAIAGLPGLLILLLLPPALWLGKWIYST